ncbi:MAG TPA: hypothetical protein VGO47_01705 [Chlamydiales bacterium]|nr:hypothetical protein [Chlamydiales bacterium]
MSAATMENLSVQHLTLTIPFLHFPWRTPVFDWKVGYEDSWNASNVPGASVSTRLKKGFPECGLSVESSELLQKKMTKQVAKYLPQLKEPKMRKVLGLV